MGIQEKVKSIFKEIKKEAEVIKGERTKDKIYQSENNFQSEELAKSAFVKAKSKLFDVNKWTQIPALINSEFRLYTPGGNLSSANKPAVGDYIKILLPGPLPPNWVVVEDIKEGDNFAEFTVRPSHDPTEKNQSEEVIKHFFDKRATSTFKVERIGQTIKAYEIGKNETVNVEKPEAGNRSVLNVVVAEGGWAAVQEIQWNNLTDYLVDKK